MRELRTVAVGFDGSPESAAAVHWGAALCASVGATLKVIHVVGLLEEQHLGGQSPVTTGMAVRIAEEAGLPADRVEWDQLSGSPSEGLLRAAQSPLPVDLLVVGTRGSGRRAGIMLGSTSVEVAQHAPIPVVIVPETG